MEAELSGKDFASQGSLKEKLFQELLSKVEENLKAVDLGKALEA